MSLDINDVHQGASHQLSLHRNLRYEWEWWGKREGILLLLLPPELSRQIVSTDHKQNRMNKPNEQSGSMRKEREELHWRYRVNCGVNGVPARSREDDTDSWRLIEKRQKKKKEKKKIQPKDPRVGE